MCCIVNGKYTLMIYFILTRNLISHHPQLTLKLNMSWQAYTDNLIGTGKIDQAALYSRAGDSLWAQSNGYQLGAQEIASIAKGFDDPDSLFGSGLHLLGVKYFVLRADDKSIYGKQDAQGVVIVRTKQAILIAHYPATTLPNEATPIVEKLADYLISVGY